MSGHFEPAAFRRIGLVAVVVLAGAAAGAPAARAACEPDLPGVTDFTVRFEGPPFRPAPLTWGMGLCGPEDFGSDPGSLYRQTDIATPRGVLGDPSSMLTHGARAGSGLVDVATFIGEDWKPVHLRNVVATLRVDRSDDSDCPWSDPLPNVVFQCFDAELRFADRDIGRASVWTTVSIEDLTTAIHVGAFHNAPFPANPGGFTRERFTICAYQGCGASGRPLVRRVQGCFYATITNYRDETFGDPETGEPAEACTD